MLQSPSSSLGDWRKELLHAVGKIIEHEHGMLASVSMAAASSDGKEAHIEELLQEQVCLSNCGFTNCCIFAISGAMVGYSRATYTQLEAVNIRTCTCTRFIVEPHALEAIAIEYTVYDRIDAALE